MTGLAIVVLITFALMNVATLTAEKDIWRGYR